jgi:hypothetical protein
VNESEYRRWTGDRVVESVGTNAGATELPFQTWRRFKEAFVPELVAQAIRHSQVPVRRCVDPFGGSGTTALTCQFLGVHPVTIEVNPFLADLIEAKLCRYNADRLAQDFTTVMRRARSSKRSSADTFAEAPPTFVEPGVGGRWIFDKAIADRIARLLDAIEQLECAAHKRFFRVLLGASLVDVSNVVVSGKGRRYRRRRVRRTADELDARFSTTVRRAIEHVHDFSARPGKSYDVRRGDCRVLLEESDVFDLAVFSPPYPNSFDYTDVYNVELWALGYLQDRASNWRLRHSTLSSHVQLKRSFRPPPDGSATLDRTLAKLRHARPLLWSPWIPEMVGAYFSDLVAVMELLGRSLVRRGAVWAVLGDSRYADIHIPVATILSELVRSTAFRVEALSPFRSMRASAQQGGQHRLSESLLVLARV